MTLSALGESRHPSLAGNRLSNAGRLDSLSSMSAVGGNVIPASGNGEVALRMVLNLLELPTGLMSRFRGDTNSWRTWREEVVSIGNKAGRKALISAFVVAIDRAGLRLST